MVRPFPLDSLILPSQLGRFERCQMHLKPGSIGESVRYCRADGPTAGRATRANPIAAAPWKRTHALDPAAAELAGDMSEPTELNGEHPASVAIQHQNDETKPIAHPEAG
jgi:hypothetical protein